ncbi:hypothetical protein GCM10009785_00370 [Brooklawnia cerclae]|uniref:DNA 3'-5' helicase n=1 Tax=Brooklawnia cerclae TaxID=349934 RepID=A0ABX0SD89_9ACTN|nr:ATP-dependent DNA helicase [Brooklawnia cerclae]NIH56368.1 DNA helicase-2/ATP-dependent DNA helicase PcrA [Brooklawnia cerclae]
MTMGHPVAIDSPGRLADLLDIPFSDEQLAAITAPLEPGVIIAGAGTGKTTVMAARVVWLVGTGQVQPAQVLGLTFTRKAAAELSARVENALESAGILGSDGPDESGRQVVMTYDAFAGRVLGEHGLRMGVETDQVMITDATRYRLAASVVAEARGPFRYLSRVLPPTVVERVLRLDGQLRSHLVSTQELREFDDALVKDLADVPLYRGRPTAAVRDAVAAAGERDELAGLVDDYQEMKRRLGAVEFADQMANACTLVDRVPGVARALRGQFAVVLLDEYQDTSSAQARLLHGLFSGRDALSGRGHPVTAVGDPFQAIYGWRGAAPSNILQFAHDFPRGDGTPATAYALTVNRRSRPAILVAANELSAPLRADERLRAVGADGRPVDQMLHAPAGKRGGELQVACFDTWPQEVDWVSDRVAAAHDSGRAASWSQIAVLVRRNADIGPLFGALSDRDVPVEIVGLGGLLRLPEVADVVATLTVIDDVTANPEVVRLLSGPRWRIGEQDLAVLGTRARELAGRATPDEAGNGLDDVLRRAVATVDTSELSCLMDAIDDPGEAPLSSEGRRRLAAFSAELRGLRAHRDEPVLELTHRVIDALGVGLELQADAELFRADRRAQLVRFVDAVAEYVDVDGDGSLGGLLAWLDAELEHGVGLDQALPTSEDSVKLMTVHRAKGLEWDVVFVPSLVGRVFPNDTVNDKWTTNSAVLPASLRGDRQWVPQLDDLSTQGLKVYPDALRAAQRQSEDRLAYVAVTRARNLVVASAHHWRPGEVRVRPASPYFEVLERLARLAGGVVAWSDPPPENPAPPALSEQTWPVPLDEERRRAQQEAADLVRHSVIAPEPGTGRSLDVALRQTAWHELAEGLVAEERRRRARAVPVELPRSVSASALMVAHRDPAAFASQLMRPMPRPVSTRAGVGTRFHHWLELRFNRPLSLTDDDDFDAPEDPDEPATDLQLARLMGAFQRGRFADRVPVAVEEPFILVVGHQQIRGRIDAVFTSSDADFDYLVVDWKTSTSSPDPLQLSLYRVAWAQSLGIPESRVDAAFYHVISDELERPEGLLDTAGITRLVTGLAPCSPGSPGSQPR